MSTDKVYEVTSSTAVGGVKFMNVMHFMFPDSDDPSIGNVNDLLTKIGVQFYNALSSNGPPAPWSVGSKVTVFDKDNPSEKTFVPAVPAYSNEATSGELAVAQLSVCINWFTASPGRSSTGRTFYGPLRTTVLSNGRLTAGALSSFSSVGTFFPPSIASLSPTWWFGVYSKHDHEFYPILTGHTDGIVDTLRSRKT